MFVGVVICIAALSGCSGGSGSDGTTAPPRAPEATQLAFTVQPSDAIAGTANTPAVQVAVHDAQGNTVTTSAATVTLAIGNNPAGGTLSGTMSVAAISGVATFSSLSLNKAGAGYTLTASATGLTSATSSAFKVSAGPAAKLVFAVQPSNAVAGTATTPSVQVAVHDAQGNTVTTSTANVTLTIESNPGGGTLSGTTTVAAVSGVATFASLSFNKTGTGYTLTAAAAGLTSATSSAFNVSSGTAAKLVFAVQPSNTAAGEATTPGVQVAVQDAQGNAVTTANTSVTIAIGTNPTSGALSGTTTVAAIAGIATFANLSLNTVGTGYTLIATATGLTSATSSAFDVSAGPAAKLAFTVQPSNTVAGVATTPAVQVGVEDAYGNVVTTAGTSVSVAIGTNPASGTLFGTTTVAAVSGVATFSTLSVNRAAAGYTLTASATGLASTTSKAFNVGVGPVATISVLTGNNQSARAGTTVATAPTVRVTDQSGNVVPGTTVAFVVTAGGGSVSGATQTTASDGTATLGGWTLGQSAAVNRVEARVTGISAAVIEARSWTVSPSSITLHSIGESQTVTAALGDSTAAGSLTISTESRWLQETPVADNASLIAGIVRATAPGSARIHVRAFGLDLGDVPLSVVPPAPIVFSVQQPNWPRDPTLVIRGYQMNALPAGAVLLGGSPVTKINADSAQFTANPGISPSTDCVLSVTDVITVPGFTVLSNWTARRFTAVNAFAVGDTLTMQGGSFCLKLPPQLASYAIAQVERSVMDQAMTTREAYQDTVSPSPYTFSVTDRNVNAGAAPALRLATPVSASQRSFQASITPPDTRSIRSAAAKTSATDIWNQVTPWVVGDLISTPGIDPNVDILWRVMRIYPNNVVLAISQADSALLWAPEVVAKLDSAFSFFLGSAGQSIYQTTFGNSAPTTSPGSGQYLALLERRAQQGLAYCNLSGSASGTSTDMQIGSVLVGVLPADGQGGIGDPPASAVLGALAHEYAHSWDCMRTGLQGPRWSIEGLADLVASEMHRLYMGLPVDGNLALSVGMVPPSPPGSLYTWWPLPYLGQFQNGYSESASFMQHLAWRLHSAQGVPWEQARATVILGSSEGWYGQSSSLGPGLASRVRQIAGSQWEPVDARLDWILSLAADDRATGAATSHNYAPTFQTWQTLEAKLIFSLAGWSFYRGTVVVGAGQSVSGAARADDNGYIIINDPSGLGAALELRSSVASMVWRVLRYR